MLCNNCQQEFLLEDAVYCPYCGKKLATEESSIKDGDDYCPKCLENEEKILLREYMKAKKDESYVKDEKEKIGDKIIIWHVKYQKFIHERGVRCRKCGYEEIKSKWTSERKIKRWRDE